jgi:hypothetical protein
MNGWLTSRVRCVICTNVWVAAYEAATPEGKLECPNCGACDSEIIERVPPKQEPPMKTDSDDLGKTVLTAVVMGFSFSIGTSCLTCC